MSDRRELTEQVLARVVQLAVEGEELADTIVKLVAQADFCREPIDDALQICRAVSGTDRHDMTMIRAAGLLDLALRVGRFAHPSGPALLRSARVEAQLHLWSSTLGRDSGAGNHTDRWSSARHLHPSRRRR